MTPPRVSSASKPSSVRLARACLLAAVCCGVFGCGKSEPSEAVLEARRLFQRREAQEALDTLTAETSAEGRYLKAVALHYLGRPDAARDEIEFALQADPVNLKYRGFLLRLSLPQGKLETADELIRLYEENHSSASAALFAFWAHGAKRVDFLKKKDTKQALRSSLAALDALKTACALSAEIPELQRELFELAVEFQLAKERDSLIAKLRESAPDDLELLMSGRPEIAVDEARARYLDSDRSEEAAMVFAAALAKAKATRTYDRDFRGLSRKFSNNTAITSLHAVYLAKSKRLAESAKLLDESIARQTRRTGKLHLMRISVYIPLERGAADLAEDNLNRFRKELRDPMLMTYFEGRVLFLRKQHQAALKKLRRVVDSQRNVIGSSRKLASESLIWIKRILADQGVITHLQQASDAVKQRENQTLPNETTAPADDSGPETPSQRTGSKPPPKKDTPTSTSADGSDNPRD